MISTIIPLNKKYSLVLFLCLMTLAKVNGQNALTGRVINSSNNLPLANVNVFISQTTIGTATDSSGYYRIDKIPNGKFNLVASIIGFEPKVVEVDLKSRKTMVINFSLEPTSYQLKQIEVTEKAPNEWKRQLNFFKKLFFGYNKYAEYCVIENETLINFFENDSLFSCSIDEPIKVVNQYLGYKIECILKNFVFDKKLKTVKYNVYPNFSEYGPTEKFPKEIIQKNRNEAYYGSLAHFLTCLTKMGPEFKQDGFEINFLDGNFLFGSVDSAKQIVMYDEVSDLFYLEPARGAYKKYRNWRNIGQNIIGLKISYISSSKEYYSQLIPNKRRIAFGKGGNFLNQADYIIFGDMAKDGVASMLPLFWESSKDVNGK